MSNKPDFRKIFLTASIISAVLLFFALLIYALFVAPLLVLWTLLFSIGGVVVIGVLLSLISDLWEML